MITFKQGDILTSEADTLVCPVNCKGKMGAGLAKHFKNNFSFLEEMYARRCRVGTLKIGKINYCVVMDKYCTKDIKIILFPTKDHWKDSSKIEYIEKGLENFVSFYTYYNVLKIKRIAFPMLGCGLGGLKKEQVLPLMKSYLEPLNLEVEIWNN